MDEAPPRFEDDYPEAAAFMMRVFAAGGRFKQPRDAFILFPKLPPIKLERNVRCPCQSGRKVKQCHPEWCE